MVETRKNRVQMLRTRFTAPVAGFAAVSILAAACSGSSPAEFVATSVVDAPPITAEPLPEIDPTPNAPVGLVVIDTSDGTIELAWDPSRDDAVEEYEVSRVSPAGSTQRFLVDAPSFIDSGLTDGDIYSYRVVANGADGTSGGSDPVTVQVGVDSNPPKRPSLPSVVESEDAVSLQWAPVTDISGIDRYLVTRTIGTETVEIDNGDLANFSDSLDSGTVVTYSVKAVDGAGNTSDPSRPVTVLAGVAADRVVVVVSAVADPKADPSTERLRRELLDSGFSLTWFEDDVFDSNITTSDDVVLLLGDVQGEGFDWNLFGTDAAVIGLKSMFVEAGGITENSPKLDRLAQLDWVAPGAVEREVVLTATGRPKPVVYIPPNEQLQSLETWARPVWSTDIAVAGLIPKGGELANEKPALGCRAFFPGNIDSLGEQTDAGWELLIEFVGAISEACV
jgi:hypothetical protein